MASASFRESLNSLGWSRRDPDIPVNTSQQGGLMSSLSSLNPFGGRGYVQLPTTESSGAALPAPTRAEEEEGWFVCESLKNISYPSPSLPLQRKTPADSKEEGACVCASALLSQS